MISESQRSLLRTLVESDGAFRLEKLQEEEAYLIVTLKLTRPDGEVLLPPILDGFDIEAFSLKGGTLLCHSEAAMALSLAAEPAFSAGMPFAMPVSSPGKGKKKLLN